VTKGGIKGFSIIPTQVRDSQISSLILSAFFLGLQSNNNDTVEPVLMATCIERPPPYKDHLIIPQMKDYTLIYLSKVATYLLKPRNCGLKVTVIDRFHILGNSQCVLCPTVIKNSTL